MRKNSSTMGSTEFLVCFSKVEKNVVSRKTRFVDVYFKFWSDISAVYSEHIPLSEYTYIK